MNTAFHKRYVFIIAFLFGFLLLVSESKAQWKAGPNDTILVAYVIVNGDTMTYKELETVFVFANMTPEQQERFKQWTRLRNAVYVTYPYAIQASAIINDVNVNLTRIAEKRKRAIYLKGKEADLKKRFADPITKLSIYQGKVLMKLINRETNNNCYDIIKEYRGGLSARFWQTVAWIFSSSLKQEYDPRGQDAEMESIVKEVAMMYGRN
ncbi:MAG: DUF4294 domain-containing protein [Sphingobacteriales bacterium]|jgi:hypothetical protein